MEKEQISDPFPIPAKYEELLRAGRGTDRTFETRCGELWLAYRRCISPHHSCTKATLRYTASNGHITVPYAVQTTMKLGSPRLSSAGHWGRRGSMTNLPECYIWPTSWQIGKMAAASGDLGDLGHMQV